ncbi:allatostatin A-like [Chelonus insularis]|uniref:allatostatin A-like n=1 Tax=Chelonus insularis TaxID=460826 RepID=UPI0015894B83|nr:allatostatin A-like [Chelonus insularis]XP_034937829.1 allatostatin A-like [Chelonus insularis]XP_034937830.1 allatostatin A-like [Chelonus insularis]XP_034937831.1 allatostatin A-like [Chelonus insularis]
MNKTRFVNVLLICYLGFVTGLMEDSRNVFERSARDISQRLGCAAKKDYDFITEYKRLPENRYVAEYKRFPEYRYSFGIGKRWFDDTNIKRNSPYSFGVGKRLVEKIHPLRFLTGLSNGDRFNSYLKNDEVDDYGMKRGAPSRSYDFGIGKRSKIFDVIDEDRHMLKDNTDDSSQIMHNHDQDKGHLDVFNTNALNSNEDHTWDQY